MYTSFPADAAYPEARVSLVGSTLFGTTQQGGGNSDGTVFSLATVTANPSGATNTFVLGGSGVAVDSGLSVSSIDSNMTTPP